MRSARGFPAIEMQVSLLTWPSSRMVSLVTPVMFGVPGGSKKWAKNPNFIDMLVLVQYQVINFSYFLISVFHSIPNTLGHHNTKTQPSDGNCVFPKLSCYFVHTNDVSKYVYKTYVYAHLPPWFSLILFQFFANFSQISYS